MLNISGLKEGFVLDHIQAGRSMDIYFKLGLDKLDCQVAIIKNARSSKMGRKDIIKIDGSLDLVNVDVLGYIDHRITINIIKDIFYLADEEKEVYRCQYCDEKYSL